MRIASRVITPALWALAAVVLAASTDLPPIVPSASAPSVPIIDRRAREPAPPAKDKVVEFAPGEEVQS